MRKRSSFVLLVLASLTIAAPGLASAVGPKQWRIVWTESPQNRAVVCWNTSAPGSAHRVYFDTRQGRGRKDAYRKQQACGKNGPYSEKLHYHHAELTGLAPATTYYFIVASDNTISREFHFTTAPAEDVPFKIIFGGDSRSDRKARQGMNRRVAALASADGTILALAHGGDYIGSGTNLEQWIAWMSDHELTVTPRGRIIPVIPARGNHEGRGPIYDQVFSWPGGGLGRNYFATRLAPEVMFVTLNTETNAGGEQSRFLETTLAAASRLRWRVVQYHRPVYPAVKGPGAGLKYWVPLFEKHNVALACEADGHCLKRTVPIRDGKADPTGVVYIGEGGLGVGQRTPKKDLWYVKPPGMVSRGHHVHVLSFSRTGLRIDAIGMNGNSLDTHTIANRRKERPTKPKKPVTRRAPKPTTPKPDAGERRAKGLFEMARQAENAGQREAAASLYSKIAKDYADTSYAERARKKLDSLRK